MTGRNSVRLPVEDPDRLAALDAYAILDTAAEQGFEDIVQLATQLCAVPMAFVSLVDRNRQWLKARVGFPACAIDLDRSVCKFVLDEPDLLIIPDLTADPRTCANPLVTGEPHIRFYAGAPLRTAAGQALGSLCMIDGKPRSKGLTKVQADALRRLARQTMAQIELRRAIAEKDAALTGRGAELHRTRRLRALAEASVALFTTDDPVTALEPLLRAQADSLGFDRSCIYDLLPGSEHLSLNHAIAVDEKIRPDSVHVACDVSLCGIVAQTGHPLVLTSLQGTTEARCAQARHDGLDAYAGFPIVSQGELRGVIAFGSTAEPAFHEEALNVFATIARLLSIAKERLAQDAGLRRSEGRYRSVFESVTDYAIIVMNLEGEVTNWNEGATRILGWSFDEICGKPADVFFTEEDRADGIPAQEMHSALTEGRGVDERWHQRKDGERFWASGEMQALRTDEGSPIGFVKILRDRTEQRRSAERLREADRRLAQAQEVGGVGLFSVGIGDGVLHPTPEFCRLYGLPERESYPSTAFEQLVIPEDAHLVSTAASRLSGEAPRDVEYRIRRADTGALRWIARKGELEYDGADRPTRFAGVARDVTEQRTVRDALADSERHWRGLFEQLQEGFILGRVIRDARGRITD